MKVGDEINVRFGGGTHRGVVVGFDYTIPVVGFFNGTVRTCGPRLYRRYDPRSMAPTIPGLVQPFGKSTAVGESHMVWDFDAGLPDLVAATELIGTKTLLIEDCEGDEIQDPALRRAIFEAYKAAGGEYPMPDNCEEHDMRETIEITLKVPADAVDFSYCGDGCGEVYGSSFARVQVGTRYGTEMLPVLQFADGPRATQLMHDALGEQSEAVELTEEDKRTLARMADHSRRIAEEERQRLLNDPPSKRSAQA